MGTVMEASFAGADALPFKIVSSKLPFIVSRLSPHLCIYVCHHCVIGSLTIELDVGQGPNMAIIYVEKTCGRKFHSFLFPCLPLMKCGI